MVNALFSSRRPDGTKHFTHEGIEFGWQAIMDMYSRECERRNNGTARTIPRLREVHVLQVASSPVFLGIWILLWTFQYIYKRKRHHNRDGYTLAKNGRPRARACICSM